MKPGWAIGGAVVLAVVAGWFFLGSEATKTVDEPPCVIWKNGLSVSPVMDLDYRSDVCNHVADMLNRDEYMTGTSPVSTPTFVCRCR